MARQTNVERMSFSTRPELRGTFGMVASTHWLASAAGMAVLEQGGNAFDAAVATGFTLQVVEPHLNGPGGDLPALLWPAERERPLVLCAQGPAPQAATIERYRDELGLELVPGTGPLAAVVPGAFGGWIAMLREHGTLPLRDVLHFAIGYAEDGYPVVPAIGDAIRRRRAALPRRLDDVSVDVYLPVPEAGDAAPEPARSPPPIAASSRRPKPRRATATPSSTPPTTAGTGASSPRSSSPSRSGSGSTARASATPACSARTTCATGRRRWEEPLSVNYHGYEVFKAGPWSQAPVFLQQLRLLEGFDLGGHGPGGRRVGAHDHRVREARVRRPRGLVRRPGLHGRAARRPPLAGVRGGAPRAARRGGLGRAAARLARRPRAAPAQPVGEAPVAPGRRRADARATPSTSTSSTATGTWSRRRRAAAGSGARPSSRRSASASARARRCSGSRRACRTRSSRASVRARRSRRRLPPTAASRASRSARRAATSRTSGRCTSSSPTSTTASTSRPRSTRRTTTPRRSRRASTRARRSRGMSRSRIARAERRSTGLPRARARGRGVRPVDARSRHRRRARAGRDPEGRREPARRAGYAAGR